MLALGDFRVASEPELEPKFSYAFSDDEPETIGVDSIGNPSYDVPDLDWVEIEGASQNFLHDHSAAPKIGGIFLIMKYVCPNYSDTDHCRKIRIE